jgi:tetratricopeptide (TPR) repeat protein
MDSVEKLLEIGSGFLDTGKHNEAISYFNKAIEINPENSEAYEFRGMAKYMLLEVDDAMQDVTTAISLDNNNHKALSSRANLFAIKQEFDKAIADLENASAVVPENLYYLINLAQLYLVKKNFERALSLTNIVLNQMPTDYDALFFKAIAHCDLKQYQQAIECYLLMQNHYSPNADISNGLGFCQIYTGELTEAKKNFNAAIKYAEGFAYPWNNLGYVYYLEKDYQEALKLINNSIRLDASNSWAFKNRALVYLATNDKERAYVDLLHARELGYTKDYDNEVEEILNNHFPHS